MMDAKTTFKTRKELEKHIGQKVTVVGVYTLIAIPKKKRLPTQKSEETWPAVLISDGTEILLESFWFKERERPKAEQQKLKGKMVLASGTLHSDPPLPIGKAENIGMYCLSPIDEVKLIK